jgi:hypothetical protein
VRSWSQLSENGQKRSGDREVSIRPGSVCGLAQKLIRNGYPLMNGFTVSPNASDGKLAIDGGETITEEPTDKLGLTLTVEVPRCSGTAIVIPKAKLRKAGAGRLPAPVFFRV